MSNIIEIKTLGDIETTKMTNGGIVPFGYSDGELYFLFGKETRDVKSANTNLMGVFGEVLPEGDKLDGIVNNFWLSSFGFFGTKDKILEHVKANLDKLVIIECKTYNGIVIFLPIEYDKHLEKYFGNIHATFKLMIASKKDIVRKRDKGYLKKDLVKWYTINDLKTSLRRFRLDNYDIVRYVISKFIG